MTGELECLFTQSGRLPGLGQTVDSHLAHQKHHLWPTGALGDNKQEARKIRPPD